MTGSAKEPFPQAAARALYARLRDGDPVASSELAEIYLDWLADWLARVYPSTDPHDCTTAAEDALLDLIHHPERYQPERSSLASYLRRAAKGDLFNRWRHEQIHRERRVALEVVELLPVRGNYLRDERAEPGRRLEEEEAVAELSARIPAVVLDRLTEAEARAWAIWRTGERRTAPLAVALGYGDRPPAEQRQEVKRFKDRLRKRIIRGSDHDG
jgi:hypothetical protein